MKLEDYYEWIRSVARGYCARYQCLHLIDDVTQETCLKLLKAWPRVEAAKNPKAYMRTTVKNAVLDELGRTSEPLRREPLRDVAGAPDDPPLWEFASNETEEAVIKLREQGQEDWWISAKLHIPIDEVRAIKRRIGGNL